MGVLERGRSAGAKLSGLLPSRRSGWCSLLLALGILGNTLRLRQRARSLKELVPAGEHEGPRDGDPRYVLVEREAVEVDVATREAAERFARSQGVEVLDLVPADLAVGQALDLLRAIDPRTYRADPFATGRSAGHATFVECALAERARVPTTGPLGEADYVGFAKSVKRHAARSSDVAVATSLRAVPMDQADYRARLEALWGPLAPFAAAVPVVECALVGAGLALSPGWGAVALGAWFAQPFAVFPGSPLRPPDLTARGALLRAVTALRVLVATMVGQGLRPSPDKRASAAARAAEYHDLLAGGIETFFEPRRETCPICGEASLSVVLRTRDLVQGKPGEFELDECAGCGHVFQNPRLSLKGLDFYYKDFYDGEQAEVVEIALGVFSKRAFRGRAEIVTKHTSPSSWLDVGGALGHFCLFASGLLPETRFEGLDMSPNIVEAERRGWLSSAHVGLLPELAAGLRERFDVVSMSHYLEHTRDPREELASAVEVLVPGGHLMIEVPDPECRWGRLFGPYWFPWLQPQHLHFLSVRNLTRLLGEAGFTVVEVQRAAAHQSGELVGGLFLLIGRLGGPRQAPWTGRRPLTARLRRASVIALLSPLMPVALLVDQALRPLASRLPGGSNSYRVLARKDGGVAAAEDLVGTTVDGRIASGRTA